jgi:arginine-tRNA-protein transferase
MILDHLKSAHAHALPYVYLGYWVQGSDKMEYKIRFRPIEALGQTGWSRI